MAAASTAFKVQCPSCEAKVTVKDPSLAGKKIDCPKCKYRFVVEAPAETEGSDEQPAAKSAGAANLAGKLKAKGESANGTATKSKNKPLPKTDSDEGDGKKKKKEKKKGGMNPTLLIGGGLGLVAIIVLICVFTGVFDSDSGSGSGGGGDGNSPPQKQPPQGSANNQNQGKNNQNTGKNKQGGTNQPKGTPDEIARRDPTNLLPGDSQYVLKVNAESFIKTPIGSVFFDESSDSAGAFKRWMGFGGEDVDQFICSGGIDAPWFFGVFTLKKDVRLDDLKAAMELESKPKEFARPTPKGKPKSTEKPHEMYTIRSNDIIKMLGDYLAAKLPTVGINSVQSSGNRTYAFTILNARTLIIADQPVLERFLQADAKPAFITTYAPIDQTGGGMEPDPMGGTESNPMDGSSPVGGMPIPPQPVGPPMGGPMGGRPMGGMQGGGNQNRNSFTTNPSFLTVHSSLKSMLNQLEDDQSNVLVFATRLTDSHRVLGDLVRQYGSAAGLAINLIPKQTVVGVCVKKMDDAKLTIQAAIEYPDAKDAYDLAQNQIIQKFAQYLAAEFSQMTRVLVGIGQNSGMEVGPNGPGGQGPYGPGGPMGPGPFGPGGPMGPGPFGPGPGPMRPGGAGSPDGPGRRGMEQSLAPPLRSAADDSVTDDAEPDDDIFLIAQKPMGGPIGPGPVGPGPVGPGPVGPGPVGPGPIGPGPGPFDPNNPNPNPTPTSFVSITSSDKLLVIDIDIEWKPQYYNHISPSIRTHVDGLKGEAMMMTGRAHWHQLATVVKRFEKPGAFPLAAYPRKTDASRFELPYPPDERVSWMCDMLPFLGYDGLSRRINREAAWNDERNLLAGAAWVSEFLNPELPQETWRARVPSLKGRDLGATHFVGLTGIGMESGEYPDTPEFANKLGLFGWNRQTKLADVTDGLSNTIFMIQAPPNVARPWLRGGGATAQGVPTTGSLKPFVAQTKAGARGTYVLMADGSIRFLKEGIEDPVFQALVTYKAGDKIADIEQIAPKEKMRDSALVTPPVMPKVEPPKVDPPKGAWREIRDEKSGVSVTLPGEAQMHLPKGFPNYIVFYWLPDENIKDFEVDIHANSPRENLRNAIATSQIGRPEGYCVELTFGENKGAHIAMEAAFKRTSFRVFSPEWIVRLSTSERVSNEDREKFFGSLKIGAPAKK